VGVATYLTYFTVHSYSGNYVRLSAGEQQFNSAMGRIYFPVVFMYNCHMENISSDTLHWLAGLLEGEGSFLKPPPSSPNSVVISLQMTDEDIVSRVSSIFGVKYHRIVPKNTAWKDSFSIVLRGVKAMELMKRLQPLMGSRRQKQIQDALGRYDPERRDRAIANSRKLSEENLLWASENINSGTSLRSCSRSLGVHHESLRRALQDSNRYQIPTS